MTKTVGCRTSGYPAIMRRLATSPTTSSRGSFDTVLEHGRRDTAEVREMIRQSVKEFQRQIGR